MPLNIIEKDYFKNINFNKIKLSNYIYLYMIWYNLIAYRNIVIFSLNKNLDYIIR